MGKTPTPLTVLFTDPTMLGLPAVQELQAKGHQIGTWEVGDVDVFIGPNCWRLPKELAQDPMYLDLAIKNARKVKGLMRPRKGKAP